MDVEIERPHHHHKTGHHWLDKVVPLSALLISTVSIGVAYHHGEVMQALVQQNERLVQANSLPYVELYRSYGEFEGAYRTTLAAYNNGVGPANIRSVQIKVDGRPVTTPNELTEACCADAGKAYFGTSTLLNRMLPAGQMVSYVEIRDASDRANLAKALAAASLSNRIVTTLCYCSVFEECWITASAGIDRPRRVDSCPMPEPQYRF